MTGNDHDHTDHIIETVQTVILQGGFELPDGRSTDEVLEDHDSLKDGQDRLAVALEGPFMYTATGVEVTDLDGHPQRDETQGIRFMVTELYKGVNGGDGFRVKRVWTTEQRALYVTLAGFVSAFLSAGIWFFIAQVMT